MSAKYNNGLYQRLKQSMESNEINSKNILDFEDMIMKDADQLLQYNGDCVRKRSNWSVGASAYKFDNADFDPAKLLHDMKLRSPKMTELLRHIKELDAADMRRDGQHYKHFIFSDLKSGLYGAKLIAAAFIADGYHMGYGAKRIRGNTFEKIKLLSDADLDKTAFSNFYLLSSVGVFDRPIAVATKKAILQKYNARPDNVHGRDVRFIIMDSGFKEGIDLFDVKYIHIFEPQTTAADQKQVIGRGTRTCGQKGLVFNPTKGWPLYVFNYDLNIGPKYRQTFYESATASELYLKSVGIDFRQFKFASDLERVSMYGSIDYELNKKIHDFSVGSSSSSSKSLSKGGGLSQSAFIKSKPLTQSKIKTRTRTKSHSVKERLPKCPKGQHRSKTTRLCKRRRCADGTRRNRKTLVCEPYVNNNKKVKRAKTASAKAASITSKQSQGQKTKSSTYVPTFSRDKSLSKSKISDRTEYSAFRDPYAPDMQTMSFDELRHYVRTHFSEYAWDNVKMENMCIDKSKSANKSTSKKGGGKTDLISFTPTQDFIRHYFTPLNPVRGMLLWHSVGTGKTCSAIAAATTAFEPAGYTILWVTRTTLKNDIWKNMFDQVCHEQFRRDRVKVAPDDQPGRMKMLSKAWSIRPMSYKQFSNLVMKRNSMYDDLVKKNGAADPLHKTLLIIDEAHKLYGGTDLSSAERPDMPAFHRSLMNSYLVSGSDSVKLLLMTATPVTNDPMELIRLLNLCKLPDDQMPATFDAFSDEYLSVDDGTFTESGQKKYLDDVAGHISFLNRERDARQFAQPHIETVHVPMVSAEVGEMIQSLDKKYAGEQASLQVRGLVKEQREYERQLEGDLSELSKSRNFDLMKDKICPPSLASGDKSHCHKMVSEHVRIVTEDLKQRRSDIKDRLAELRERIAAVQDKYAITGPTDAKAMAAYKQTTFFNLKHVCGQKSTTDSELIKNIKAHPTMLAMDDRAADLDSEIVRLKQNVAAEIDAYKNRVLALKEELRTASEKENKRLLQAQIQKEKKAAAAFEKREKTALKTRVGVLTNTRKNLLKNKNQAVAKMRKHFIKTLKDKNARTKAEDKAVSKERSVLRRESRSEQSLQADMIADVSALTKKKERIGKKADQDYKQDARDQKQVIRDEKKTKKAKEKAEKKAKANKTRKRH